MQRDGRGLGEEVVILWVTKGWKLGAAEGFQLATMPFPSVLFLDWIVGDVLAGSLQRLVVVKVS